MHGTQVRPPRRVAFNALNGLILTILWAGTAQAQADSPSSSSSAPSGQTAIAPDITVEQAFTDFLYYARLGRFVPADVSAKALLSHPDLNPAELVEIADKDRKSIETIQMLIERSTIADSARKVMEVLERGRYMLRKDPERIQRYIEDLGGTPQQEMYAIKGLIEGGEYSVAPMIAALQDPARKELWPRIIQAMPRLQKEAVGPLTQALLINDNAIRQYIIQALGTIGYPQAIPFLRKVAQLTSSTPETKTAANAAVGRIESLTGRSFPGRPDDLFFQLSERYFNEDESVRADIRLETANVWYWDVPAQALKAVVVPTKIFGPVMAMRMAEEALLIRNDNADAIALWLGANIRREARLGMNVESSDPGEKGELDPTRPPVFPRALYFTQAAGPRYAHMVLGRAVKDGDSAVALGAIEALRLTAGEASLVGREDAKQPLTQSLRFPDIVVRIRAALALGAALPKSDFADSQLVVSVLAATLGQSGRDQFLVADADGDNGNRVAGLLRNNGADVIVETNFFSGLKRARREHQQLTGVFVATDIGDPGLGEAFNHLRGEYDFARTPVVILAKAGQDVMASDLTRRDDYTEAVDWATDETGLLAALERARQQTGQGSLNSETALAMALQSVDALRRIVVDGRTVYDVRPAGPALIGALSAPDERLQTGAASVLALLPTPSAQRAIAHVALNPSNTVSLRVAAFGSLSESARTHGDMLEDAQISALVDTANKDSDLVIRTAASQALGAVNLASNKASEIIRGYYGG